MKDLPRGHIAKGLPEFRIERAPERALAETGMDRHGGTERLALPVGRHFQR